MNCTEERNVVADERAKSGDPRDGAKVAFIHNFAPYYRKRVLQAFSRMCDVEFFFYSDGGEWYWPKSHGVSEIGLQSVYLRGFWLGRTRIALGLIPALLSGKYNVFIKCINGRFALPVTFLIARLRGVPFILWTGLWHRLGTRAHKLMFPLTRYLYRHADAVVAYGEHVKRYLITEGVDPDRIFLAQQSVDNAQYRRLVPVDEQRELKARYNLPEDKKIVLYLGRLVKDKGLEYLLEAFARVEREDTVLVICGTGNEQANLQALAGRLRLGDRVRFLGHVPPAQTVPFYSIAWVAVLPSVTTQLFREPWGLTVNETFNQGVPVIASDAVGAAAGGLLQNGRNGFVARERDSNALHEAMETILANPDLRDRLGRQAFEDVAEWTQERQATGFRDAVNYVITERQNQKRQSR